jgi:hypothetical protein
MRETSQRAIVTYALDSETWQMQAYRLAFGEHFVKKPTIDTYAICLQIKPITCN